jgi:hypothetical protein
LRIRTKLNGKYFLGLISAFKFDICVISGSMVSLVVDSSLNSFAKIKHYILQIKSDICPISDASIELVLTTAIMSNSINIASLFIGTLTSVISLTKIKKY